MPTTDWVGHPVVERQHQIFERLADRHEVHVLRFRYYKEKNLNTKAVLHEINDNMVNSIATYYLINVVKHKWAIEEIVRRNQIDIVVLSNLLPAFTSIRALRKEALSVFDLSDHFPTAGAGYIFDIQSILGKLSAYALEIMLKYILNNVNCTVACSYPLKEYAASLGAKSTTLIPNGVDDIFFARKYDGGIVRQKYDLNDAIVVGFVGMVEFWLNMTPLLQAIKELKKRHKIKLFIIGKRFQTRTQLEVQRKINELNIRENVVWSNGFVPYHELPGYIAAMDLCVIPFNYTHPTAYFSAPNKLWEYLALGKPVLTTPLPDILIQAGQFVNIVIASEDYVKVIEDYIRDPEKYRRKAERCQRLIGDRTWTKISEMYEQLLTSLCESQKFDVS